MITRIDLEQYTLQDTLAKITFEALERLGAGDKIRECHISGRSPQPEWNPLYPFLGYQWSVISDVWATDDLEQMAREIWTFLGQVEDAVAGLLENPGPHIPIRDQIEDLIKAELYRASKDTVRYPQLAGHLAAILPPRNDNLLYGWRAEPDGRCYLERAFADELLAFVAELASEMADLAPPPAASEAWDYGDWNKGLPAGLRPAPPSRF